MSECNVDEYNICGVLVHAHNNQVDQVKKLLEQQEGVEVHAVTDNGRLVVTVEHDKRRTVGDRIMGFYELPGVLSAAMIYQYSDNDLDVEELEINNAKPKNITPSEIETRNERMPA